MSGPYSGASPIRKEIRNGFRPTVADVIAIDEDGNLIDPEGGEVVPLQINDGLHHPVGDFIGVGKAWSSLADCQTIYPHVDSISDEMAWAAIYSLHVIGKRKRGTRVLLPAGSYQINKSLTLDVSLVGFDGPSTLVFSDLDSGSALVIEGSLWDGVPKTDQLKQWFSGLSIIGPGRTSSVTGLYLHGAYVDGSEPSPAHFSMKDCTIEDFGTGVLLGDNAFILNFQNVAWRDCGIGFHAPSGIINSGERQRFTGCVWSGCGPAIKSEYQYLDAYFDGCSIDYGYGRMVTNDDGGWMFFSRCHFEDQNDGDNWIYVSGTDSSITLRDCTVVAGGSASITNYSTFYSNTAKSRGGIRLFNPNFFYWDNTYYRKHLCDGDGPIICKDVIHWGDFRPTISENLNLVSDGGFETGVLGKWVSVSENDPSISSSEYNGGSYSLKLSTPITGACTAIRDFACNPGDTPFFSCYYKASNLGDPSPVLRFGVQYIDANGTIIQNNNNEKYTDQSSWTLWTPYHEPAPAGTSKMRVFFQIASGATDTEAYIDDFTVNICGQNAAKARIEDEPIKATPPVLYKGYPGASYANQVSQPLSSHLGKVKNIQDWGGIADGMWTSAASMTEGDPTLTLTYDAFTSSHAQKTVWVKGAGTAGAVLASRIKTVTDARNVELYDDAATTVSNTMAAWGTDNATAFNNAISDLSVQRGGVLSVPECLYNQHYIVASQINLSRNVTIKGAGDGASILLCGWDGACIVQSDAGSANAYNKGGIDNVVLQGTSSGDSTIGLFIGGDPDDTFCPATNWGDHTVYRNVKITGFGVGVKYGNHAFINGFHSCWLGENGKNIWVPEAATDTGENNGFWHCVIGNAASYPSIQLDNQFADHYFHGCSIDYNGAGPALGGKWVIANFHDCHWEQHSGAFIDNTADSPSTAYLKLIGGIMLLADEDTTPPSISTSEFIKIGGLSPIIELRGVRLYSNHPVTQAVNCTGTTWPTIYMDHVHYNSAQIAALTNDLGEQSLHKISAVSTAGATMDQVEVDVYRRRRQYYMGLQVQTKGTTGTSRNTLDIYDRESSINPHKYIRVGTNARGDGNLQVINSAYTGHPLLELTDSGILHVLLKLGVGFNLGAGDNPTALLHLVGGTATAGTAPLKIDAGTLLSAVENGAVENDGTDLYVTLGGTRYKLIRASTTGDLTHLGNIGALQPSGGNLVGSWLISRAWENEAGWVLATGYNCYWNGSNWIVPANAGSSGASIITTSTTDGTQKFYTLPNIGNTGYSLTNAQLAAYLRMTIDGTSGEVVVKGAGLTLHNSAANSRILAKSADGTIVAELFAYDSLGGYVGTYSNHGFNIRVNDADAITIANTKDVDFKSTVSVNNAAYTALTPLKLDGSKKIVSAKISLDADTEVENVLGIAHLPTGTTTSHVALGAHSHIASAITDLNEEVSDMISTALADYLTYSEFTTYMADYYTASQVDFLLTGKANASHNHSVGGTISGTADLDTGEVTGTCSGTTS